MSIIIFNIRDPVTNQDQKYKVRTSMPFWNLLKAFIDREGYIPQKCKLGNVDIKFKNINILRSTLGQIGVDNNSVIIFS